MSAETSPPNSCAVSLAHTSGRFSTVDCATVDSQIRTGSVRIAIAVVRVPGMIFTALLHSRCTSNTESFRGYEARSLIDLPRHYRRERFGNLAVFSHIPEELRLYTVYCCR